MPENEIVTTFNMSNGDVITVTIAGFSEGEQVLTVMSGMGTQQVQDQVIEELVSTVAAESLTDRNVLTYTPPEMPALPALPALPAGTADQLD